MATARTAPTPETWTLRFKNGKTTVMLFVDPLHRFSDIRAELLRAIRQTNTSGKLNGHDIPTDPDDIMLGRTVEDTGSGPGFEDIYGENVMNERAPADKGKGKGRASEAGSQKTVRDCPKAAGIQANGVVAFKFKSEHEQLMQAADTEIGDTPTGEDEEMAIPAEKWNVQMPSFEETYGDEDEIAG